MRIVLGMVVAWFAFTKGFGLVVQSWGWIVGGSIVATILAVLGSVLLEEE